MPAETEPGEKKTGRKLTPAQWALAVEKWELGAVRLADLSAEFGISETALSLGLKSRGATKGRRAAEHARSVSEAVSEAVRETAVKDALDGAELRKKRINDTKKEHYEWSAALSKLAMSRVLKAQKDGTPLSDAEGDLKAIRNAMEIIARGRQERWEILDVPSDIDMAELPELVIRDLTDNEVDELRRQDEGDGLDVDVDLSDVPEVDL
ncbi:hypothetical protein F1188_16315 [Roseospira marina]|uniref:DNA-binding protein n=1 Tax=Roseospira marina TaxID=140057 RepID=A0A5M6I8E8_9PROT|nr:hypothetical protein [Roseospira marina]KAA5604422.1 hypothetical protein F1188_16315 [Roseospira marina]MBB4315381.1 hypothetical protein [Roseospira marina]MBB5088474.1 hypothetical protein [Roseospira marina]